MEEAVSLHAADMAALLTVGEAPVAVSVAPPALGSTAVVGANPDVELDPLTGACSPVGAEAEADAVAKVAAHERSPDDDTIGDSRCLQCC